MITHVDQLPQLAELLTSIRQHRLNWPRNTNDLSPFEVRFIIDELWGSMREAGLAPPKPPDIPSPPLLVTLRSFERQPIHALYHDALNVAESVVAIAIQESDGEVSHAQSTPVQAEALNTVSENSSRNPVVRLVTRSQIAMAVHLAESAMTPYVKKLGEPYIQNSGRRATKWDLEKIMPILQIEFPRIPNDRWEFLKSVATLC